MQISEIFYSLQGEGVNIGVPAVFLRLAGCNLRCEWCDTKYSWGPGEKMSIPEILQKIKKYPAKHLVVTGGEPLMQQEELSNLLQKLPGYYVEIETNGSFKSELNKYVDQYNCSPKLNVYAYQSNKYADFHTKSANFSNMGLPSLPAKKTYYKFVVDKKEDLGKIKKFIEKNNISREKVILMPQGTNRKDLTKKSQWLAEICKKENLRFTPRMQIDLWGDKRKR